eukprot:Hpha_TRINITY_DN15344_c9_g1::TRINITY_DN15344_c9_g1_i1::g.89583::m.89583
MDKLKMCAPCYKWALRPDDSPDDAFLKKSFVPVIFVVFLLNVTGIYQGVVEGRKLILIGSVWLVGIHLWNLFRIAMGRDLGLTVDVAMVGYAIGTMVIDLSAIAELRPRVSVYVVLILDGCLVWRRHRPLRWVLGIAIGYSFIERMESGFGFGLYDWGTRAPEVCNCAEPPCPSGFSTAFTQHIGFVSLLLLDFYLTRGFAMDLFREMSKVKAAIEVVGDVASAFAKYDVDGAEVALQEAEEELPRELAESFMQLLANLRSYKAYLPHSCLVGEDGKEEELHKHIAESPGYLNIDPETSQITDRGSMSDDGSSCISDSSHGMGEPKLSVSHVPRAAYRRTRVSLAAGNMVGYLSSHGDAHTHKDHALASWIAADVERWCSAVVGGKGVVDLIGGDRRYASFNARSACGGHASTAVEVLSSSRGEGAWSGCVVTGQAVCGDFGSNSMLRFMIMGPVPSSLRPLERLAAGWKTAALLDCDAFGGASFAWEGMLLGAVLYPKRLKGALRLYSMLQRREHGTADSGEWMYQIATISTGRYAAENEAAERRIRSALGTTGDPPPLPGQPGVWWLREVYLLPCTVSAGGTCDTEMPPLREGAWSEESPAPQPSLPPSPNS